MNNFKGLERLCKGGRAVKWAKVCIQIINSNMNGNQNINSKMFDFFVQIIEFSIIYYIFYMKKIVLVAFLGLILAAAQTCPQGQMKINGGCVAITYIPGCASYSAQGICNVCEYGYQSVDGVCQATDRPTTQCCVLTDNNGVCQQCAPGLYLDGNSCLKVVRPGCLEGKGNVCTNCANGYQNINGRCFRAIDSCQTYSSQGQCTQCASGYEVIRGLCSPVASAPLVQYCLLTNEYGCVRCSEGFYLTKNRSCVRNQVGCIKHFREDCQLCLPQFKLINGKCLMDGCKAYGPNGCTACSSSQYNLVDGVCVLDNCLQTLNGQCVVCQKDYRYKNGVCVKSIADRCTSCANGYFVGQDGRCYKNIVGCQVYAADGTCSTCLDVFVNNLGVCVIPGCDTYGSQGCQICQSPFKLSSGRCYLDNCNQHNYVAKKCKSCKVGYHIQNGVCVLNKPLCASYSLNGDDEVCSACAQSDIYILTDAFNCQAKKPGCVYQYGKCISCAYPFKKVDNGVCVIDGCAKYSLVGCQLCTLPFQLNLGSCIIANCDQVTNYACTRCSAGYHLSSNGQCAQDDSKCTAYLGDVCQSCIAGYRVSKQGVCVREIANCNVLSVDGCLECAMGYQYVVNQCVLTDKYCSLFDSRGKGCSKCIAGYHTQSGVCVINDATCAVYSDYAFTQSCTQCANNYIFSTDGKCVLKAAGCIYNNKGVCSSCRDPFKFVSGKCVLTGCVKYSQNGCYQCDYPFQLNGNQCIISFCQSYDGNTCSLCQSGYKLIQGQCYRLDPKCIDYSASGDCQTCINQYIVFQGVCVKKDNNCQVYSKLGGCNTCKDGYYLSLDNNCLPQEPGCVYKQGKCTYCNYPFKFNQQSQKCRIDGCLQAVNSGCTKCQFPYTIAAEGVCQISNCLTTVDNHCVRCTIGYHLKQGMTCVMNDINCLQYNDDGDCQVCAKGYLRMSSGECAIAEDNCIDKKKSGECVACKDGYYVNTFFQCQQKDQFCQQYINGVCTRCDEKHFLYQLICFPYSPGCVAYTGKDCIRCKPSYTLKNGECFNLKKPSLQLEGNGDQYDFDINPIDITKSKYYIDNLSPISKLGKVFYSSFQLQYIDARLISENQNIYSKGWKAENARSGEYIGYTLDDNTDPLTFYAIQISDVDGNYISSFYIEYSVDGVTYTRVSNSFDSSNAGKNLTTIYFTGIYAKAIRIVVKGYVGWPAARIQFFYYDTIRFRKISNLKSLTYLKESIQSNFVDRMDNQMYINQRIYFQPNKTCLHSDVCFTGLQLCQAKTMNSLAISATGGNLKSVYIMYSTDGVNYGCFQKCRYVLIDQTKPESTVLLNQLSCKNMRVYPVEYTGTPSIHISYSYS